MYSLSVAPREWQKSALAAWMVSMRGVVSAVTGAGKTTFTFLCAEQFLSRFDNARILIIVPTTALLDQWVIALTEEFGVEPRNIGQVGGGKSRGIDRKFIVCVINSARKHSGLISETGNTMLVVDECHRAGSVENSKALNGKYSATLGLSATPERQYDSGFEDFVVPVLGNVVFKYSYESAFNDGIIVPFDMVNVKFKLSTNEQKEYDSLTKKIVRASFSKRENASEHIESLLRRRARVSWNSPLRVPIAVRLAILHRKERMIVFHESVQKATETHDLLRKNGIRSTLYHTGLGESTRRENLRLYKRGYYTCMVCCRALDEGLNVPQTSIGIIACSTSSLRQRIQRLGRILRQSKGKGNATVYTLFATKPEEDRLLEESVRLSEVAHSKWISVGVQSIG